MSEAETVTGPLPVVPWLKDAASNDPYLEGHKVRRVWFRVLGRAGQLLELRCSRQDGALATFQ